MLWDFPPRLETIGVLHFGGLGDIIYSLPVAKELAKSNPLTFYVTNLVSQEQCRNRVKSKCTRCNNMSCWNPCTRLLLQQPYIFNVLKYETDKKIHDIDWKNDRVVTNPKYPIKYNLNRWRKLCHYGKSESLTKGHIIEAYMDVFNVKLKDWKQPWLHIENSKRPCAEPYIIVSLTERYKTNNNWKRIIQKMNTVYKEKVYFIGTKQELGKCIRKCGRLIPHLPTIDVLEMAQYIKEASLVITNQTCSLAIAQGLGVPYILDAEALSEHMVRLYNDKESVMMNEALLWSIDM